MSDNRADYAKGLRELADFVENHPDLPVPDAGSHNIWLTSKEKLAELARGNGSWEKRWVGNYFILSREFAGGHTYELNVARNEVCRKVVTGTKQGFEDDKAPYTVYRVETNEVV